MTTRPQRGWLVLSAMILLGLTVEVQGASDYVSISLTSTQNTDNPDLRGFDPNIITSPNDAWDKLGTDRPSGLTGSTMFGNGVSSGTSGQEVNQNCSTELGFTGEHPPTFPTFNTPSCIPPVTSSVIHNDLAFQSSRNGLLSRRSTATTACNSLGTTADDRRCNEITFGFLQDVQEQSQVMDLNFLLRSLTDADGNLIGAAQGTFTQSITQSGVTTACSGSFTFDDQNGFVMTSGPLHECQ